MPIISGITIGIITSVCETLDLTVYLALLLNLEIFQMWTKYKYQVQYKLSNSKRTLSDVAFSWIKGKSLVLISRLLTIRGPSP